MQRKKYYFIFFVFIVTLVIIYFVLLKNNNTPELITKMEEIYSIGLIKEQNDSSKSNLKESIFGNIASICTDSIGNLYVLDNKFFQIKIYSRSGNLWKIQNLKKGDGPGELFDPRKIAIDEKERIYLSDIKTKKINTFSKNIEFISSFKTDFWPTTTVCYNDKVYATGFWLTYQGPLIYRYDISGGKEMTFLDRPTDWKIISLIGNFDRLIKANGTNMIYSFPMPYKILLINEDGIVLKESTGQKKFDLPKKQEQDKPVTVDEFPVDITCLPSGYILSCIKLKDKYKIDIFSKEIQYIGEIDLKSFNMKSISGIASDIYGDLYIINLEPLPHIRKFRIEIYETLSN